MTNQTEVGLDLKWKSTKDHPTEYVRNTYVEFRIITPWYPEKAFRQSTRWHQVSEVLTKEGKVVPYHEYNEHHVDASNVIRPYCPSRKWPLKSSTVGVSGSRRAR